MAYPISSATRLPANTLIEESLTRLDYSDAFGASFRSRKSVQPARLLPLFFAAIPAPARWLLAVREVLARVVGLKTAQNRKQVEREMRLFRGRVGERIGLFEVLAASPNELLTGTNDRHLDFRLSFLLQRTGPEVYQLWLLTQVQTHNRMGRSYLEMIKPIHRWLMRRALQRMVARLEYS